MQPWQEVSEANLNKNESQEQAFEEPSPTEKSAQSGPAPDFDNENLLMTPPAWDELKQPMVELLLKYYNNEDNDIDLIGAVGQVIEIFCKWQ